MRRFISLNPDYILKPDEGRTLIMARFVGRNRLKGISDSFTNIIHPIYAMILSCMDGREYEECIDEAAKILEVPKHLIEDFINKVLDNHEQVYIKNIDSISAFPPNTIITLPSEIHSRRYEPMTFSYSKLDLRMKRHLTPSSVTLMVNNICMTDCVYCYQDKTRIATCTLPLDRIFEIIREARKLNVNSFDVIGGEFFLYKHWREVLRELKKYGFNPYLSTKIPLEEKDIKFLAEIGICDIQLSIDSLIEDNLKPSLGISSGYVEKMHRCLKLLEKYNIPVMVHSVLTKYNASVKDMDSVFNAITEFSNLIDWHIVKGEASLYPKVKYSDIEIKQKDLNDIVDHLENLKAISSVPIHIPQKETVNTITEQNYSAVSSNRKHKFFQRSFCSGLFSSLYILPNGQVTMCEQLYWNKDFIVGDVTTSSLEEVWNSDKAKSIFFIKQEDIPADSICHSCNYFEACRSIRQVCYREIIKKYGKQKWYYPDANCPFSKNQHF